MSVTNLYNCPECNLPIQFESAVTNVIQCKGCFCIIHRNEADKLGWIRNREMISDAAFIQPGTRGKYDGEEFRVTGRIRTWADDHTRNYWAIIFKNGAVGLLRESYGLYLVTKKALRPVDFGGPVINRWEEDQYLMKKSATGYVIHKTDWIEKWELEGEGIVPLVPGSFYMGELALPEKQILLTFGMTDRSPAEFYQGTYCELDDLALTNLRPFKTEPKIFECINCKKKIEVKFHPYTRSIVCPNCYVLYKQDRKFDFVRSTKVESAALPVELGTKGKFNGVEYELTGYAVKSDNSGYEGKWREYTLFNPEHGFAFLSEYAGHWIFLEEYDYHPHDPKNALELEWEGESFPLFNRYTSNVESAKGEFAGNIMGGKSVTAREFISPPEMWSQEKTGNEYSTWYFGKYLDASKVKSAFPSIDLPKKQGIGMLQPTGFMSMKQLGVVALLGCLVLGVIHMAVANFKSERQLVAESIPFDAGSLFSYVSPEFTLEKSSSNIEVSLAAPVNNKWVSVSTTLVNKQTGDEQSIEQGIEFYTGVSDGESWSEGSTTDESYFTGIPAGRYVVQMQGMREAGINEAPYCNVVLTYDVSNTANLWFAILVFLVLLAIKAVHIYFTEKSRWRNSPFSTYD